MGPERIGQGRENARAYLEEHPELMAKLEAQILVHNGIGGAAAGIGGAAAGIGGAGTNGGGAARKRARQTAAMLPAAMLPAAMLPAAMPPLVRLLLARRPRALARAAP